MYRNLYSLYLVSVWNSCTHHSVFLGVSSRDAQKVTFSISPLSIPQTPRFILFFPSFAQISKLPWRPIIAYLFCSLEFFSTLDPSGICYLRPCFMMAQVISSLQLLHLLQAFHSESPTRSGQPPIKSNIFCFHHFLLFLLIGLRLFISYPFFHSILFSSCFLLLPQSQSLHRSS